MSGPKKTSTASKARKSKFNSIVPVASKSMEKWWKRSLPIAPISVKKVASFVEALFIPLRFNSYKMFPVWKSPCIALELM